MTAACTLSGPWACHAKEYFVRSPTNHVSSRWLYMQLRASHAVTTSSHMSLLLHCRLRAYWLPIALAGAGTFLLSRQCSTHSGLHCQMQVPRSLLALRMLISIDCLLLSLTTGHFSDLANVVVKMTFSVRCRSHAACKHVLNLCSAVSTYIALKLTL